MWRGGSGECERWAAQGECARRAATLERAVEKLRKKLAGALDDNGTVLPHACEVRWTGMRQGMVSHSPLPPRHIVSPSSPTVLLGGRSSQPHHPQLRRQFVLMYAGFASHSPAFAQLAHNALLPLPPIGRSSHP